MGSILRCPHPVTERIARRVFVLLPLREKQWGLFILLEFNLSTSCHHTSCITLFVMNLTRREAVEALSTWSNIVVDVESFQSTCHRRDAYMIIAMNNVITMCFLSISQQ